MRPDLHVNPYATVRAAHTAHATPALAWGDTGTPTSPVRPPSPGTPPEIANNVMPGASPEDRPLDLEMYTAHRRPPPAWQFPPPPPLPAPPLGQRACRSINREHVACAIGFGVTATLFVATSAGLRASGASDAESLGFGGLAAGVSVGLVLGLRWAWRQWTERQAQAAAPRGSLRDLPTVRLEPQVPVANPGQTDNA